jgi:hypothetical protein
MEEYSSVMDFFEIKAQYNRFKVFQNEKVMLLIRYFQSNFYQITYFTIILMLLLFGPKICFNRNVFSDRY